MCKLWTFQYGKFAPKKRTDMSTAGGSFRSIFSGGLDLESWES